MTGTRAFIGVSLDSTYFNREWVRHALGVLSARYDRVMMLLADDVLKFSRTAVVKEGAVLLKFAAAEKYVVRRRSEVARYLEAEIYHMPAERRNSVACVEWRLFADSEFNELHRKLRIAYETIASFRSAIDIVAYAHGKHQKRTGLELQMLTRLNASYILEECAMCMRITELEGYSDEYHPSADLPVLPELYAGEFAKCGLTVEAITGKKAQRSFSILTVP